MSDNRNIFGIVHDYIYQRKGIQLGFQYELQSQGSFKTSHSRYESY